MRTVPEGGRVHVGREDVRRALGEGVPGLGTIDNEDDLGNSMVINDASGQGEVPRNRGVVRRSGDEHRRRCGVRGRVRDAGRAFRVCAGGTDAGSATVVRNERRRADERIGSALVTTTTAASEDAEEAEDEEHHHDEVLLVHVVRNRDGLGHFHSPGWGLLLVLFSELNFVGLNSFQIGKSNFNCKEQKAVLNS